MAKTTKKKTGGASETTPVMDAKAEADSKIAELTESLQRLGAEFENFKKRTEKDMDSFRRFASQGLIEDLLPVLDSFELALQHTKDNKDVHKGVELVFSQLSDVLAKRGVEKIKAEGSFDPNCHEALLTEASDKPEGTILEILQSGYTLNGRTIRAAKVKIAKKSE